MSDYAKALRGISDALEAISENEAARPAVLRTARVLLSEVASQMAAELGPDPAPGPASEEDDE